MDLLLKKIFEMKLNTIATDTKYTDILNLNFAHIIYCERCIMSQHFNNYSFYFVNYRDSFSEKEERKKQNYDPQFGTFCTLYV